MFRNFLLAVVGIAVLAQVAYLLCQDIPGQGLGQSYFVVANSDHSVRYEQGFLPSIVYFYGDGVKTISNPSPQKQCLVVYNYSNGQSTRISNQCALKNDRYLVTIQNHSGQTMAETVLEISSD